MIMETISCERIKISSHKWGKNKIALFLLSVSAFQAVSEIWMQNVLLSFPRQSISTFIKSTWILHYGYNQYENHLYDYISRSLQDNHPDTEFPVAFRFEMALIHVNARIFYVLFALALVASSARRVCPLFLLPFLIFSAPISYSAMYIEHFLFVPSASQPTNHPVLVPAVILQATRHVNYYANKQCETSVPTSHKTARIPSDFRARHNSASVLRMSAAASPLSFLFPPA